MNIYTFVLNTNKVLRNSMQRFNTNNVADIITMKDNLPYFLLHDCFKINMIELLNIKEN